MAQGLNELKPGQHTDLGLIVQGGLFNTLVRALQGFGLADAFAELAIPTLILNVTRCLNKLPTSVQANALFWSSKKDSPNTLSKR